MNSVYVVTFHYTETYCHPDPDQWSQCAEVVCITADETIAEEARAYYTKQCKKWEDRVSVRKEKLMTVFEPKEV